MVVQRCKGNNAAAFPGLVPQSLSLMAFRSVRSSRSTANCFPIMPSRSRRRLRPIRACRRRENLSGVNLSLANAQTAPSKHLQSTCMINQNTCKRHSYILPDCVQFAICMCFECIMLETGLLHTGFHAAGRRSRGGSSDPESKSPRAKHGRRPRSVGPPPDLRSNSIPSHPRFQKS